MARQDRKTIRFQGREEPVLETFRVRGRSYFALEQLSRRGAFRVFDPLAAPGGDYRVLYRFPASTTSRQKTEVLRRLAGPNANRNFPQLVECVRSGGDLYVVVGWVWGTNLRVFFRAIRAQKTPRPSVPETVRLVRGLVHGLGHFHRRANIIHGDISPANIVLTSGTTQLVVVDFGSAWPVEQSAMKELGDGVTQPYAAPERLANQAAVDFRSDIFSLSVVAYEMLTLEIPFDGLGGQAGLPKLIEQAEKSYRPPSELLDSTHRFPTDSLDRLDRCVGTGLALHPDGRFGTRADWLSAWDGVHNSLKKGDRLTRWEKLLLKGFDFLGQLFRRKKT
jgi:serine/threonine protein kinase